MNNVAADENSDLCERSGVTHDCKVALLPYFLFFWVFVLPKALSLSEGIKLISHMGWQHQIHAAVKDYK